MSFLIDTAKAIRRIEATGLAKEQAEAIVESFSSSGEQLATKGDIDNLRNELNVVRNELKCDIDNLRNDLNVVRNELKADNASLRIEPIARIDAMASNFEVAMFKQTVWVVGLQLTWTAVVLATLVIML